MGKQLRSKENVKAHRSSRCRQQSLSRGLLGMECPREEQTQRRATFQTSWRAGWSSSLKLLSCPERVPRYVVYKVPCQRPSAGNHSLGCWRRLPQEVPCLRAHGCWGKWFMRGGTCCEAFPGGARGSHLWEVPLVALCCKAVWRHAYPGEGYMHWRSTPEPARETPCSSSIPPVPSTDKA